MAVAHGLWYKTIFLESLESRLNYKTINELRDTSRMKQHCQFYAVNCDTF